jgi:hypothetical protein
MIMPVSLFLALGAMIVSYALGQGGPIAAIFFLGIVTGGAIIRYAEPLRNKLKP